MPDELISGTELADRLGVSRKTIQKAYQVGWIKRDEKGLYSWPRVKTDFMQSHVIGPRKLAADGEKIGKGELSLAAEQKLLVRARREKVETENKVIRGELLSKKDVQKAITNITAQLKTEFQNFPVRLAPALSAAIIGLGPEAKAGEIEAIVRKVWEDEAYKSLDQILSGEILP